MSHLRNDLALKLPVLTERAKTSRASAVKLFCIECMGGSSHEAKNCAESTCPLWPHAYSRGREAQT